MQMILNLQRGPLTPNSSQWERLPIEDSNDDDVLIEHCQNFADWHRRFGGGCAQVCVYDVQFGLNDAPLVAVYWANDRHLQRL